MKSYLIVLFLLCSVGNSFAADSNFEPEEFFACLNKKTLKNFLDDLKGDIESLQPDQRNEIIKYFEENLKGNKLNFISYYQRSYGEYEENCIKNNAISLIAKMLKDSSFEYFLTSEYHLLHNATGKDNCHLSTLIFPGYLFLACLSAQWAQAQADVYYPALFVLGAFLGTGAFCALLTDLFERGMKGPKCGFSIEDAEKICAHVLFTCSTLQKPVAKRKKKHK